MASGIALGCSLSPIVGRALGSTLSTVGECEGSTSGACGDGATNGIEEG